jgi:voltage-gated potassium channel
MHVLKRRIFTIVELAAEGDTLSKVFDISIISLIIINVIVTIVDTFSLPSSVRLGFEMLELISTIIFSFEYMMRLYSADLLFPAFSPLKARLHYATSFMAVIDLLAIIPFYMPFLIAIDLRVLRMIRVTRLFRIFKVNRYTNALSSIAHIFKKKKSQLLSSVFVVVVLIIIASVLMYNVENPAQPEIFTDAFSSLWWAVATLTTVGYGDIYPITAAGKFLSTVIAVLGIGLVAVPTGIISAGFIEEIETNDDDKKSYCPYCGKKIK